MGRACAEIEPNEIDLSQLTENIINTKKVILQPFESRVISGMMKGPIRAAGISKRVNVLTKPMCTQIDKGSHYSAVPAYTYVSPGSSRARVMLKNLMAQPVTMGRGQTVAAIKPGNEVPKMLALKIDESGLGVNPRVSKTE